MASLIDRIFDNTLPGLERTLDLEWKRNQAITSNIANVETPTYRAVDLDFAGELDRAFSQQNSKIMQTNPKHMDLASNSGSHLVADFSGATRADGNNVDIDIQMGKLIENSNKYMDAANLIRKKFQSFKNAIRLAER